MRTIHINLGELVHQAIQLMAEQSGEGTRVKWVYLGNDDLKRTELQTSINYHAWRQRYRGMVEFNDTPWPPQLSVDVMREDDDGSLRAVDTTNIDITQSQGFIRPQSRITHDYGAEVYKLLDLPQVTIVSNAIVTLPMQQPVLTFVGADAGHVDMTLDTRDAYAMSDKGSEVPVTIPSKKSNIDLQVDEQWHKGSVDLLVHIGGHVLVEYTQHTCLPSDQQKKHIYSFQDIVRFLKNLQTAESNGMSDELYDCVHRMQIRDGSAGVMIPVQYDYTYRNRGYLQIRPMPTESSIKEFNDAVDRLKWIESIKPRSACNWLTTPALTAQQLQSETKRVVVLRGIYDAVSLYMKDITQLSSFAHPVFHIDTEQLRMFSGYRYGTRNGNTMGIDKKISMHKLGEILYKCSGLMPSLFSAQMPDVSRSIERAYLCWLTIGDGGIYNDFFSEHYAAQRRSARVIFTMNKGCSVYNLSFDYRVALDLLIQHANLIISETLESYLCAQIPDMQDCSRAIEVGGIRQGALKEFINNDAIFSRLEPYWQKFTSYAQSFQDPRLINATVKYLRHRSKRDSDVKTEYRLLEIAAAYKLHDVVMESVRNNQEKTERFCEEYEHSCINTHYLLHLWGVNAVPQLEYIAFALSLPAQAGVSSTLEGMSADMLRSGSFGLSYVDLKRYTELAGFTQITGDDGSNEQRITFIGEEWRRFFLARYIANHVLHSNGCDYAAEITMGGFRPPIVCDDGLSEDEMSVHQMNENLEKLIASYMNYDSMRVAIPWVKTLLSSRPKILQYFEQHYCKSRPLSTLLSSSRDDKQIEGMSSPTSSDANAMQDTLSR